MFMQYISDELSNNKAQYPSVQLTEKGFRDNDNKTNFTQKFRSFVF